MRIGHLRHFLDAAPVGLSSPHAMFSATVPENSRLVCIT
jgi:hypothetical protein